MCLLAGILFLTGKTEGIYKSEPFKKKVFSCREREILLGTTLMGVAVASLGATITNGAANYCLLLTPGPLVNGIGHWIGAGDKKDAMLNWVFMLLFMCVGLCPRVIQ